MGRSQTECLRLVWQISGPRTQTRCLWAQGDIGFSDPLEIELAGA
jgi:hypothetical protein